MGDDSYAKSLALTSGRTGEALHPPKSCPKIWNSGTLGPPEPFRLRNSSGIFACCYARSQG
jgi:hypothetical protein